MRKAQKSIGSSDCSVGVGLKLTPSVKISPRLPPSRAEVCIVPRPTESCGGPSAAGRSMNVVENHCPTPVNPSTTSCYSEEPAPLRTSPRTSPRSTRKKYQRCVSSLGQTTTPVAPPALDRAATELPAVGAAFGGAPMTIEPLAREPTLPNPIVCLSRLETYRTTSTRPPENCSQHPSRALKVNLSTSVFYQCID